MVWMGRQIIFIYFLLGRARYQKWQERILKDQIAMGSILFWAQSSGQPHRPRHRPSFLRLQEKNWSCHLLSAASHLQWELPQHCWWILTLKLIQADLPTSSQSLVTLRLISRLSTLPSWERIHLCLREGYQIGWKVPRGGEGHFQSKNLYCRFWELSTGLFDHKIDTK